MGEGYNFGLGRILIRSTKEEMRRLRLIKAEGNYRTWKEMFLDKSGVKR